MQAGYAFLASAIISTALAQISYKIYFAKKSKANLIVSVLLFVVTPFLAYSALKELSLSIVYMSTGLTYVLVLVLARLLLGEKMTTRQFYAASLIVCGVLVFNF